MLQESDSDLFGHRKGFLSAGADFWGETQSAADIWEDARGGQTGLQPAACSGPAPAEVGGSMSSRSDPADGRSKKQSKTVVCVLVEKLLSAW